ncbi:hypothetical protein [Trebonia sp.]|uniref:hypothetical protein n=1 Tax=Trebonia sp. TaxID=2767075 RepID=UPI002632C1F3|nr:hypothetical protein [Trebonia sp.]
MKGTWQTGDHGAIGGGGLAVLIIACALLLAGSGAAAAIAAVVTGLLIAAAVVVGVALVSLVAYMIYRARRDRRAVTYRAEPVRDREIRPPGPAPAVRIPAAPGQPAPLELHQHVHLHLAPGTDPELVAEIIRRSQRPEQ